MHEKWMSLAINEAIKGKNNGEFPVGCVIVHNDEVIGIGHNQVIMCSSPLAHAEMVAISVACDKVNNYRLTNAICYSTLEPCVMCMGAILHARIPYLYFGARNFTFGACGSVVNVSHQTGLNHQVHYTEGVMSKACEMLVSDFFKKK